MAVISARGLEKRYGKKVILNDISFDVQKGDVVGYLGPNGSGKTTTINTITGLIKANKGTTKILGYDVNSEYTRLFGKIGILFDENGLYERITVKQNLNFYLDLFQKKSEGNDYIHRLFEQMNYEKVKNLEVRKMSKGMKRMVGMVRALMIEPEILILDEPFDGIDIENRSKFIELIKEYYTVKKPAVILTSHVMDDIEQLATKVMIIKSGSIIENCSMEEFKKKNNSQSFKIIFQSDEEASSFVEFCVSLSKQKLDRNGRDVTIILDNDTEDINMILTRSGLEYEKIYQLPEDLSNTYLKLIQ